MVSVSYCHRQLQNEYIHDPVTLLTLILFPQSNISYFQFQTRLHTAAARATVKELPALVNIEQKGDILFVSLKRVEDTKIGTSKQRYYSKQQSSFNFFFKTTFIQVSHASNVFADYNRTRLICKQLHIT